VPSSGFRLFVAAASLGFPMLLRLGPLTVMISRAALTSRLQTLSICEEQPVDRFEPKRLLAS
jgi:hypothetical protein